MAYIVYIKNIMVPTFSPKKRFEIPTGFYNNTNQSVHNM